MDVHGALRNTIAQLQQDPARHKLFGVHWWPVKALLKRAGYGPEHCYLLGDYQDVEQARMVPKAGLEDTLRAAFSEYGQNARYPRLGGRVEAPTGEIVTISDADAGGL